MTHGHVIYFTDQPSDKHIQGDVLEIINDGWDLIIAHPPCTHLELVEHLDGNKVADGRRFLSFVEKYGMQINQKVLVLKIL